MNLKTKKKITLLLFNDLLILAKQIGNNMMKCEKSKKPDSFLKGEKYHVKDIADIEAVVMEDVPDQGRILFFVFLFF